MDKALPILLKMLSLGMLLGAFGFMFDPASMEADFAITALENHGMGTIRGDLGGPFLLLAHFTLYGSRPHNAACMAVPLVFLLPVLLGRMVPTALAGLSDPPLLPTLFALARNRL